MFELIRSNKRRSAFLIAGFVVVLALIGTAFGYLIGGGPIGTIVALVLGGLLAFGSYWKSDKIALAVSRARLADPNQCKRSIAIVTMSRAQQELIEDLLQAELDAPREGERLLIGTPDRLVGEERDVVFVSIGDSADALGALAHPGGERWLDVAITRAREQLIVVSSFAPEDITSDAPCARDLAELLAFARAGGHDCR